MKISREQPFCYLIANGINLSFYIISAAFIVRYFVAKYYCGATFFKTRALNGALDAYSVKSFISVY